MALEVDMLILLSVLRLVKKGEIKLTFLLLVVMVHHLLKFSTFSSYSNWEENNIDAFLDALLDIHGGLLAGGRSVELTAIGTDTEKFIGMCSSSGRSSSSDLSR